MPKSLARERDKKKPLIPKTHEEYVKYKETLRRAGLKGNERSAAVGRCQNVFPMDYGTRTKPCGKPGKFKKDDKCWCRQCFINKYVTAAAAEPSAPVRSVTGRRSKYD